MMVDGMQEERKQKKIGGAEGSRTPDLLIANETLYQLSYDPAPSANKIAGGANFATKNAFQHKFTSARKAGFLSPRAAAAARREPVTCWEPKFL